jgi:hypothetical protein
MHLTTDSGIGSPGKKRAVAVRAFAGRGHRSDEASTRVCALVAATMRSPVAATALGAVFVR